MDTLAAIVTLLKPQPCGTKLIHGRGRWGVRYPAFGQPAFALVLTGRCLLEIDGATSPLRLDAGDFVLFPAMPGFAMKSDARARTRLTAPSQAKVPAATPHRSSQARKIKSPSPGRHARGTSRKTIKELREQTNVRGQRLAH